MVDKQPAGPAPGVLWVNSKLTKPDEVTAETFTKWYQEVHIPDIFKSVGIKSAYRYESVNPDDDRPYLAYYPVEDTGFFDSSDFKAIPVHSDLLPGSKAIFDYADFDTRYYKTTQLFEPENGKPGPSDFVISAGFTPTDDADYEKWYREEHLNDIKKITGWRRTVRYELFFSRNNRKPAGEAKSFSDPPKYLTMHHFDGQSLPEKELEAASGSPWTVKNMSTMKQTQIGTFKKLGYFSADEAKL